MWRIATAALAALLMVAAGACNNSLTGFGGFVGNTPNTKPQTLFKVLGDVGTPFTLTISDTRSSWVVGGNVPLSVGIVNNAPPVRMFATKLANDNSLMSLEISNGSSIFQLSSTTAPFGSISIQNGGQLKQIAPPANPDLRVAVLGPFGERFQALVEDQHVGYVVNTIRGPALFLFDSPEGPVDAQLSQFQNFGPFTANITQNGKVVASGVGGPFLVIRD